MACDTVYMRYSMDELAHIDKFDQHNLTSKAAHHCVCKHTRLGQND